MPPARRPSLVDVALQNGALAAADQQERIKRLGQIRSIDKLFRILTRACALAVLGILGAVLLSLFFGAWPALSTFGLNFFVTESWNPVTEKFGALPAIYGTLVTSTIAIFLTELCPIWLRRPVGIAIELLAGIPSIIYGIWGFFVFAPFLQTTLQPFLVDSFGNIPLL